MRQQTCRGSKNLALIPGTIANTYYKIIMSSNLQHVKLFSEALPYSRAGEDFNHYSALQGVHITGCNAHGLPPTGVRRKAMGYDGTAESDESRQVRLVLRLPRRLHDLRVVIPELLSG